MTTCAYRRSQELVKRSPCIAIRQQGGESYGLGTGDKGARQAAAQAAGISGWWSTWCLSGPANVRILAHCPLAPASGTLIGGAVGVLLCFGWICFGASDSRHPRAADGWGGASPAARRGYLVNTASICEAITTSFKILHPPAPTLGLPAHCDDQRPRGLCCSSATSGKYSPISFSIWRCSPSTGCRCDCCTGALLIICCESIVLHTDNLPFTNTTAPWTKVRCFPSPIQAPG